MMIPAFDDLPLIPAPAAGELMPGGFLLSSATPVDAPAALGRFRAVLTGALAGLAEMADAGGRVALAIDESLDGEEAYSLAVTTGGVVLRGATPAGVFRGTQTLLQLIEARSREASGGRAVQCVLPCLKIQDRPAFAWRGLMLDVARNFFTVDEVKGLLDRMARLKFNVFHWHLTDDQGWRIEIKRRPELTRTGAARASSPVPGDASVQDGVPYGPFFYTQEEIREVVAYAAERELLVVPEIDLPGHVMAALACYPRLGCTGGPYEVRTTWGVEEHVLCLGNPEALRFALDVLEEVAGLFPGPFIHIGGDEVPRDRWKACPCCQRAIREHRLGDEDGLLRRFTHVVEAFLAARGKRVIGWDEVLDTGPGAGTVIASWRGVEGGIKAAANGNDAIMCPHTHCYLDYRETDAPGQLAGAPNGLFTSLEKCYGYEPVDPRLTPAQARRILGVQGNLWTEYVWSAEDLDRMVFPRAHALAEVGWTPPARKDFASFSRRLDRLGRHEKAGIRPLTEAEMR